MSKAEVVNKRDRNIETESSLLHGIADQSRSNSAILARDDGNSTDIDYKSLYEKAKKESIVRKGKLRAIALEKIQLGTKLRNVENSISKEKESKLKENEDYKAIIALKEQEINKLKTIYDPLNKELKSLRELKNQIELKEKTKRESLLTDIRKLSEANKNESYIAIAEALAENDKLELFLKNLSISQVEKKPIISVYSNRPGPNLKPVGDTIDPNDVIAMQNLYREDKGRYNQIISNKKGK